MLLLQDIINRFWYGMPVILIKWAEWEKVATTPNIDKIKEKALFTGFIHEIKDNYFVDSIGIIDNYLIITIH